MLLKLWVVARKLHLELNEMVQFWPGSLGFSQKLLHTLTTAFVFESCRKNDYFTEFSWWQRKIINHIPYKYTNIPNGHTHMFLVIINRTWHLVFKPFERVVSSCGIFLFNFPLNRIWIYSDKVVFDKDRPEQTFGSMNNPVTIFMLYISIYKKVPPLCFMAQPNHK